MFRCYPDDNISKIKDVENFMKQAQPELYPQLQQNVKGHIVEFPLEFLSSENLRIKFASKEFLIPEVAFT